LIKSISENIENPVEKILFPTVERVSPTGWLKTVDHVRPKVIIVTVHVN